MSTEKAVPRKRFLAFAGVESGEDSESMMIMLSITVLAIYTLGYPQQYELHLRPISTSASPLLHLHFSISISIVNVDCGLEPLLAP